MPMSSTLQPALPKCDRLPGHKRRSAVALMVAATLALSACGGGDSGSDGGPPDNVTGPMPYIEALAGDWVQKGCVKTGFQSFKKFLRATVTNPATTVSSSTTLDYAEGVLTFNGNECAGASQLVGPTRAGVVTFARAEANRNLAAHWGELRTVTSSRFGTIWTLRPNNLLCLLGDDMPTIQPTLSAVSASLATVPADNCFVR